MANTYRDIRVIKFKFTQLMFTKQQNNITEILSRGTTPNIMKQMSVIDQPKIWHLYIYETF